MIFHVYIPKLIESLLTFFQLILGLSMADMPDRTDFFYILGLVCMTLFGGLVIPFHWATVAYECYKIKNNVQKEFNLKWKFEFPASSDLNEDHPKQETSF